MQQLKLFISLCSVLVLAFACSPGGGSDDGDDSGAQGLSLPSGISGVVTGDVLSDVRMTVESSSGETYVITTDSEGNYLIPSSILKPGSYTLSPDKQGVTFVPDEIEIQYDGLGESNVDFASLFNLPDSVESNFVLTNGKRNSDLVSLPSGNLAFVSSGARVYNLDPDQYFTNGKVADYTAIGGTPTFMAVPKGPDADPALFVAVEFSSGEVRLYKYNLVNGINASEQGYYVLPAGSAPTDVAVSPNGRVAYVAREDDDIIELVDSTSMTAGIPDRVSIESPISIDVSDNDLYIVSQPVNSGLESTGSITVLPTLFHDLTKKKTVSVPLKPIRVTVAHNQEHYYLMTQPDSDNKASILSYSSLDKQNGVWTSGLGNIPTNFSLMPNDNALYVTIDTLDFNGKLGIINLDDGHEQFDYMQEMSLLSGFGNTPNAVALSIRLAPVQIAGWVSHDGSGGSLLGSMISFR
jgi:hypothetical protein